MPQKELKQALLVFGNPLFDQMPPWFQRKGASFTAGPNNVYITFAKPCTCGQGHLMDAYLEDARPRLTSAG